MVSEGTNDKIKNGKGLDPLPSSQPSNKNGTTTEQRTESSGLRRDSFTKQNEDKDK